MKKIGPTCSGLGKKIKAKDATGAADAKELQGLFKESDKFWKAKKADDAIAHSKTAGTEFAAIHKAINSGDWDAADAGFKKAVATCGGCHRDHQGRDGSLVRLPDATCTGCVESSAATPEDVVAEVAATRLTERGATRADDRISEAGMEDRKKEGYF